MRNAIVISGVAGMTGSMAAAKLLRRGESVVGFDSFFSGSRDAVDALLRYTNFRFFEYDITNLKDMSTLFAFVESQYPRSRYCVSYINCAAVVHTRHFYFPSETFQTNVIAMYNSLHQAIQAGVNTYINCSTSEVYSMKSWQEGGVREDAPVLIATAEQSLRTSYAIGKLLTECFLREAVNSGFIKGCSIRFANVYSPEEAHQEHIIPYIIASLAKSSRVTLLENARETYRSFLHNSDSCNAVIRLFDSPCSLDGSVYNAGSKEEIGIADLVEMIARLMGVQNFSIEFRGTRSADPLRRILNIDKIYKTTGWVPEIELREGLRQCIDYHNRKCRAI